MATPTYDQQSPDSGKFTNSDNDILDIQQLFESGEVIVTATLSPEPVVPVGIATTPKYNNMTPNVGKFLNSLNEIIDLYQFLTSGAIQVQVDGAAPALATYITQTDETATLPDSVPLSGLATGFMSVETATGNLVTRSLMPTDNQTTVTNPTGLGGNSVIGLSDTLVAPGTLNVNTSFTIAGSTSVTSVSNLASASGAVLMTANAIQSAIAAAIASGSSFRGGYDASSDLFPATGGSGGAGAILAGDWWFITVAGTLGGTAVLPGDQIFALVNTPGQTAANWLIVAQKVESVFGRVGNVVAVDDDYPFNFITGLPDTATDGTVMRGTGSAWAESTSTFANTYTSQSILIASAANTVSGLAAGSNGQFLSMVAGSIAWAALPADAVTSVFGRTGVVIAASGDYSFSLISGTAIETQGGTNQTTYTKGDILHATAANTLSKLGIGSNGQFLTIASGDTVWSTAKLPSTAGPTGTMLRSNATDFVNSTATFADTYVAQSILIATATNTVAGLAAGSNGQFLSMVAGAVAWAAIPADTITSVFGRTGVVIAATNDYNFNQLAGTAGVTQGGTGLNSTTVNQLLYSSATNTISGLATVNNAVLSTSSGGVPTWLAALTSALGGTGFSAYTKGDLIHASATNTLAKLGIGNTGDVLTVSGGDTVWAAPAVVNLTYNAVSSSTQALVVNNTYYTTYAGLNVMTLPTTAAAGSLIEILAGPSGNTFKIAQNASQLIYYGAQNGVSQVTTTGTGGSLQSVDPNTNVLLKCTVANTTFTVINNVNYLNGV